MGISKSGFTIVELLIVIIVIGILAAVTVVAYGAVRSKAFDASVQTDIKELAKRVRAYQAETGTGSMIIMRGALICNTPVGLLQ